MLNRKVLLALVVILCLFSIGLVGYFIFSADYGDGLEKTMEEGEVEENEPVYEAPLDYGDNYPIALAMGFLGLAVTILVVYGVTWLMRKRDASQHG